MINPDKLSDKIISDVCKHLGMDPGEDETYEVISQMDADEVIERFLTWNGIIGYGKKIRELVHIVDASAEDFPQEVEVKIYRGAETE